MNAFDFKKWVCGFLNSNPKNIYTSYRKCPDNYVGMLSIRGENWFIQKGARYENKRLVLRKRNTKKEKIVIILESPHRDEFMLNLTAPALGATGEKIHRYLYNLLYNYNLLNSRETEIYIVNAIQFQCSLGFETSKYRDKIFKELWAQNGVKASLIRRIKRIAPTIIINAITKIKKGNTTIKEELSNDLKNLDFSIWEASTHPVKWDKATTLKKIN